MYFLNFTFTVPSFKLTKRTLWFYLVNDLKTPQFFLQVYRGTYPWRASHYFMLPTVVGQCNEGWRALSICHQTCLSRV